MSLLSKASFLLLIVITGLELSALTVPILFLAELPALSGQERYDTHSGYVPKSLQGSCEEWQKLGVMNYEMESATLFTMCAALGLQAACVAGVLVNSTRQEIPNVDHGEIERKSVAVVLEAAKVLLAK